jgi:hypothetical protein
MIRWILLFTHRTRYFWNLIILNFFQVENMDWQNLFPVLNFSFFVHIFDFFLFPEKVKYNLLLIHIHWKVDEILYSFPIGRHIILFNQAIFICIFYLFVQEIILFRTVRFKEVINLFLHMFSWNRVVIEQFVCFIFVLVHVYRRLL